MCIILYFILFYCNHIKHNQCLWQIVNFNKILLWKYVTYVYFDFFIVKNIINSFGNLTNNIFYGNIH